MSEPLLDCLREELATLEAEEAQVSAERRRLHQQIDSGFGSESAHLRERQVSDRRRELHRRIDRLREMLGLGEHVAVASAADWVDPGFAPLERPFTLGTASRVA